MLPSPFSYIGSDKQDQKKTHGWMHKKFPYTIQMWWTNCSVRDRSLLLVFAPNRPSYTTCWEKRGWSLHTWLPTGIFTTTTNLTATARTQKERTWMLAGKHSAARRDRKRCGRIFSLTLVLTASCFSSCFTLPAWRKEHDSINNEIRIKDKPLP